MTESWTPFLMLLAMIAGSVWLGTMAQRAMTLTPKPAFTSSRMASVNGTCDTRAGSTPAGDRIRRNV